MCEFEKERESGCVIGRLREGDMTQLKCVKERESETTKKVLSSKDRKLKKSLFIETLTVELSEVRKTKLVLDQIEM